MDVVALRELLVEDYEEFSRSFIRVRDERVRETIDNELDSGLLWPEPLVQLNPSFAPAATIDELVADGTLHPISGSIFRRGKGEGKNRSWPGHPLRRIAIRKTQSEWRQPAPTTS